MSINIVKNIVLLLQSIGEVSLPEVGRFTLKRNAASFATNRHDLEPPSYEIHYSNDAKAIEYLISEIASTHNISQEIAKEALFKYTSTIQQELKTNGTSTIHELGVLYYKNGVTSFIQSDDSSFSKIHYNLPTISLTPIIRDDVEKKQVIEKILEASTRPSIFNEPIQKPIVTSSFSSNDEHEFDWSTLKDWLIALLITLLIICCYRTCTNNSTDNSGLITTSSIPVVEDSLLSQDSSDMEMIDVIEETEKYVECIIITGSFKNSRNALRMQDRIVSLGYEPHFEQHEAYTRVGFSFNCNGVDLEKYLNSIRQDFDIYAWYLQPQIDVSR